jgi:hypothetical protein
MARCMHSGYSHYIRVSRNACIAKVSACALWPGTAACHMVCASGSISKCVGGSRQLAVGSLAGSR